MDTVFERARTSYGQLYLDAEMELRSGGQAAIATLRHNRDNPDPIVQLLLDCLLKWIEGKTPEYQLALAYLDGLPKRIERTPITSPSPMGVAAYLTQHFGPRVADLLALRLVKGSDWPHWRVTGVLFYLKDQHLTSTTAALVRFAAETKNETWRNTVIDAIKAVHDRDLPAKIAAERRRFELTNQTFPQALADLQSAQ